MKNYKKWLVKLLISNALIVLPVAVAVMGFNYYIDPLWNFNHKNDWNDYQAGFDERQQKTNYIVNRPFDYDSLLMGTSRVTYMDQHEFQKDKVFNYSLSSLHIDEYQPYVDFAKKQNGKAFDKIYMELYFESFNGEVKNLLGSPDTYFEEAESPFYKYTSLFSYSTLQKSLDNKKYSEENSFPGPRSYNRENVAATSMTNDRLPVLLDRYKKHFADNQFKGTYPYDEKYKEKLAALKKANPSSEFIVFTDPIPVERMKIVLNNPVYWEAYERWYREMTDVYGTVYSFQNVSEYTANRKYWFDWFHYYPAVGDLMIAELEGRENGSDFCVKVTKENVDQYLTQLKADLAE
ncbi:hypothetical protein JOC78_002280 [Bacillus ectoiniformans]|uniref:hypothetical protein n=1 Tax=Bacillus ectoiniformans TaxID=1494429 RepID=UPI001957F640|nr:hypothetical protein [Bacillus ectoiniformans]MBM7649327.1 hypothetical protein [Bacillus ectoiniformans]